MVKSWSIFKSTVKRRIKYAWTRYESNLDLSDQGLTELPAEIGKLDQLRILNLNDNLLNELPAAIGDLYQLQELNLSANRLSELPAAIGKLDELRILHLSNNRLSELPAAIGELSRLQELNLSGNQLSELPESLRSLTSLKKMYLHGNDALNLPPEVLGSEIYALRHEPANPQNILDYYFKLRHGRRPLNEAKLILVGYGAVGKTSLVNRLVHGEFKEGEAKTEGISVTQWPLALREGDDVRLHIWDFGGQEIMHSTHQFFLTRRSLYLLVLNGRQGHEDADADYWLNLINSFGEGSPVIVVLNKIKEHPFDVNRRALMQKFGFVRGFIETDCEDKTGIIDLKKLIVRETDRLKHLRDPFPASWFGIKDQLTSMDDNYISFAQYQDICTDNGEGDESAQESLASYLHNLGIALNYKDDLRLRDTHVLNPRWVTNGIYPD